MAKKIVNYECEICGRKWAYECGADECEKSHFVPQKISSVKYDVTERKSEYPKSINVVLKNANGKEETVEFFRRGQ
jgi:hypothetical protein